MCLPEKVDFQLANRTYSKDRLALYMRIFIWIYMLAFTGVSHAQYYSKDSLWQVLRNAEADSNKIWTYFHLGIQYENNDPDSALLLYDQALKLSEQLGYTRGIIGFYTHSTYVFNLQGKLDSALALNLKSVEIAREFGDPERLAACLANVGTSYMMLERYEEAVDNYLQVIPLYEQLANQSRLTVMYSNLSMLYWKMKQFEKAKEYGQIGLKYARETKNDYSITIALVNLSNAHTALRQSKEAIAYLEEAQLIARQTDNQYVLLVSSLILGHNYVGLNNLERARLCYETAQSLAKEIGEKESEVIALRGLAIYHFHKRNSVEAQGYATESLKLARANGFLEQLADAYTALADVAIMRGDLNLSSEYAYKSDSVRNEMLNETIAKNVQNIEAKYQSERKEQLIKDLQQEAEIKDLSIRQNRLLVFILLGLLASVVIIGLLARRTFQQKRKILENENLVNQAKISQLESERQLLASEAVIKGQEEERGRLAKDLHDGLGGLLSGVKFSLVNMKSNVVLDAESALVFERSLDMLDNSISELRRVAHNMMPEVLIKFGLKEALKSYCDSIQQSGIFNVDFQSLGTEMRLVSNLEIILYRIVQELLNNASKYAKASTVLVQLAFHENEVSITVEDNGAGFDVIKTQHSTGAGWSNIRSRVEYLRGTVDVSSGNTGTSVHLHIPV